jgi:hypothetical protein
VFLVYAGLIAALVAGISVIKPLHFLGIRTRLRALAVLGLALGATVLGMALPASETHVPAIATRLDEFAPVYQFHEVHAVRVRASQDQCYTAIREVGPEEIALFHTLTWMRRFGRRGTESLINAPARRPILDTALRTGFLLLAEARGREIVIGAVMGPAGPEWARGNRSPEQFKALHTRYAAKIAMNFRVEPAGPGECRIVTETRVFATSPPASRAFAAYWRVIYPGSALIRRMWLRAIQRRAENESRAPLTI